MTKQDELTAGLQAELARVNARLAEQPTPVQQEPVGEVVQAFADLTAISWKHNGGRFPPIGTKLYTAPPAQRKPLTDEQIATISVECATVSPSDIYFARAIEAAHNINEKNTK